MGLFLNRAPTSWIPPIYKQYETDATKLLIDCVFAFWKRAEQLILQRKLFETQARLRAEKNMCNRCTEFLFWGVHGTPTAMRYWEELRHWNNENRKGCFSWAHQSSWGWDSFLFYGTPLVNATFAVLKREPYTNCRRFTAFERRLNKINFDFKICRGRRFVARRRCWGRSVLRWQV